MSDFMGISIEEITAFGWSDDGQHIWITHKLRDGSEYRLVYPYLAAGQLITMFTHAAGSASARRAGRNPTEAVQGMDSAVMPAEEVRIGTAADGAGAILHFTTSDNIPIAVQLPVTLLEEIATEMWRLLDNLRTTPQTRDRLH